MGKRLVARVCAVALIASLGSIVFGAPAGAANPKLRTFGGGIAKVGPVTTTSSSDGWGMHLAGASLTGYTRLDGVVYEGSMRLGAVNVFFPACDFDCPPPAISSSTELHGANSSGTRIDGFCSGLHWNWEATAVVYSANALSGTCSARFDNTGVVHRFPMTVQWGVGGASQYGTFCVGTLDECGAIVGGGGGGGGLIGEIEEVVCVILNPVGPGC